MKTSLTRVAVPLVVAGALLIGVADPAHAARATNVRLWARNPKATFLTRWGNCYDLTAYLERFSQAPGMGLQHTEHINDFWCGHNDPAYARVWGEFHLTTAWGFDARVYGTYELRTWVKPASTWIRCGTVFGISNVQRQVFTETQPKRSTGLAVQTATNGVPTAVSCGSAGVIDVYMSTFESIELI